MQKGSVSGFDIQIYVYPSYDVLYEGIHSDNKILRRLGLSGILHHLVLL
jgi:hypothetical protein